MKNEKLKLELIKQIEFETKSMWITIGNLPQTSFQSSSESLEAIIELGKQAERIKIIRHAMEVL